MRIVFATAEVSPIAKTGGLGDVCGSLPKALAALGHDVTIFMPYYRQARQWFEANDVVVSSGGAPVMLRWGNWEHEVTFLRTVLPGTSIPLVLVANEFFFERDAIYEGAGGVDDSLLRYTFFSRAVILGCQRFDIAPDVLHCHDWHTALLPVYLESGLRAESHFSATRSVYTIHNLNYQGASDASAFEAVGLHSRYWSGFGVEHFGQVNPMKGGIIFADQVTTVSPTYAAEVQTPEHGAGLDGVLRAVSAKFTGILNGIDVDEWDPATDALLTARYDADSLDEKKKNKRALLAEIELPYSENKPLFAAVSRLVDQKGFQLLPPMLGRMVKGGAQLLVLGSGEPALERLLVEAAERFPDSCRVIVGFDNGLAHRIYSGADALLMPSIYEPCGLNQMYALRYGTVPVVRLTGGLADTVIPFDGTNGADANGFGFVAPHPFELQLSSWLATMMFQDPRAWKRLQQNGMAADFSWDRSAREYDRIYQAAVSSAG